MAGPSVSEDYFLQLSTTPVRFESVSKVTNVFFDDCNRQVFTVRSGGVTGVVVKGPTKETTTSFRMEDKGPVISIKFSPNQKVLAIQRTKTSVEFVNFLGEMDTIEYSQSCKNKNAINWGFVWTGNYEIVFVTDHGVELFQVLPEKHVLKALKSMSLSVNWFVYCPQSSLLLLSSGPQNNQIQPLHVKPGTFNKLNKFEIELPTLVKPARQTLQERDVTLAVLYGQPSVVVLRHQPRGVTSAGAEVVIYTILKMQAAKKSHVLRLDMSGRFAINVVDNLVAVHHQASETSVLFDVGLRGEWDGSVSYHQPVSTARPIQPCTISLGPGLANVACQLYSPNWVIFQPNIVIDAKLGCLWYVELSLEPLVSLIEDKCLLVDFLVQRSASKGVVVSVLRDILEPTERNRQHLPVIAELFDHLNEGYQNFLLAEMQTQMGTPASGTQSPARATSKAVVVIDQADLYTNVFSRYVDAGNKIVIWILLEYIRSLADHRIPVQHFIHELLINALVLHRNYYQLHQLLQYHVVADSKPLACLLLSLENLYPAAHQLALDMLKRLGTANEEIVEVLLSKQQILPALRFVRGTGAGDQISARKFLEAAITCEDNSVFFSVYKFFEQRNVRLKGSAAFGKGEHCDAYVQHFQTLYSDVNSN